MNLLTPRTAEAALALLFIVVGAFAAGVDTAASSVPEARLRALIDELDGRRAAELKRFLKDPQAVYTRLLALRVGAIVGGSVLMSDALRIGRHPWWYVALVIVGLAFFYGLIAEFFTTVARARSRALVAWGLAASRPLEWLALPIAAPLMRLGSFLRRRINEHRTSDPPPVTEHTVEYVVEEAEHSGALDRKQGQLLHNVLELGERTARDIMVPRTRVFALEEGTPIDEATRVALAEGRSRIPVYADQIDNVVGVLHVKDLFRRRQELGPEEAARTSVATLARKHIIMVPPTQGVFALLREMQARGSHLALVVDEFGALAGVATLEDVLEQLVGEIRDEHDDDESPLLQPDGEGGYVAAGETPLTSVGEALGIDLPSDATYSSLGGFLTAQHEGRVPPPGTELVVEEHVFVVREGDERKVARVSIRPRRTSETRVTGSVAAAAE